MLDTYSIKYSIHNFSAAETCGQHPLHFSFRCEGLSHLLLHTGMPPWLFPRPLAFTGSFAGEPNETVEECRTLSCNATEQQCEDLGADPQIFLVILIGRCKSHGLKLQFHLSLQWNCYGCLMLDVMFPPGKLFGVCSYKKHIRSFEVAASESLTGMACAILGTTWRTGAAADGTKSH